MIGTETESDLIRGAMRWLRPGRLYFQSLLYLADLPVLCGVADNDRVCADSGTDHLLDYLKVGLGDCQGTLSTLRSQKSTTLLKDGNFMPPINAAKISSGYGSTASKTLNIGSALVSNCSSPLSSSPAVPSVFHFCWFLSLGFWSVFYCYHSDISCPQFPSPCSPTITASGVCARVWMSAPLGASGPGSWLDYSIPLFHEADFPPSLNPGVFQGTFQGGQDVRRALWVFALLSCLPSFLLPPVVFTSLCLWWLAPWDHACRLWMGCLRSGLNDLKGHSLPYWSFNCGQVTHPLWMSVSPEQNKDDDFKA